MPKPVILVLDDMKSRVQWLRKNFDSSTRIVWVWTASDFAAKLSQHAGLVKLIILDYDLDMTDGSKGHSLGPDGKNGLHAAQGIPTLFQNTPILIWSRNGAMSPEIEKCLRDRGFRNLYRQMFGFHSELWNYIKTTLSI